MGSPLTAGTTQRWRVIRQVIVFVVALAFLGAAFYKAVSYIRHDTGTPKTATTPCVVDPNSNAAPPYTVTVNIYNATNRSGLAAEVATEFRARGFTIGKVANDPLNAKVSGTAQVRFGENGRKEAIAVANQVKGAARTQDKRKDTSVDFVIGNAYAELKPAPTCTPPSASPSS